MKLVQILLLILFDSSNLSYEFYNKVIDYAIKKEIFVSIELINRILNNLSRKKDYKRNLIEKFIKNKLNLFAIIKHDEDIPLHLNVYFNHIIEILSNDRGYDHAKEMIVELNKANCLDEEKLNKIVNIYVLVTNSLCDKLKTKQNSFIQGLGELENLRGEMLYILQNVSSLNGDQKEKIKQCLSRILMLKRYLISDDEYVYSEMVEISSDLKFKKTEIDEFVKTIINNRYSIYNASKADFYQEMEIALETYAKHPLQSIINSYYIDSKNQVYYVPNAKNKVNDNFKKIFDEVGRKYTENHPKLLNKLNSNYYEELLKYLSKTFMIHQNLIINILGYENFKNLINDLKNMIGFNEDNEYIIVVKNILSIESNIIKKIDQLGIRSSDKGFENINKLADVYRNNADILNGLMYLNYVLYEPTGLRLRNNAMHGTLINSDLNVPLLISFSGLIFVSWLLNAK